MCGLDFTLMDACTVRRAELSTKRLIMHISMSGATFIKPKGLSYWSLQVIGSAQRLCFLAYGLYSAEGQEFFLLFHLLSFHEQAYLLPNRVQHRK